MNRLVRSLVSQAIERFAGSGVGVDAAGRLCLPDGLDSERAHRFIEIVMQQSFDMPKPALLALCTRVGVASSALGVLGEILDDETAVDLAAVGSHPVTASAALPRLLEIPSHIRDFLVQDLGLGDLGCTGLEEAVVSSRINAAERIGCAADWDEILAHRNEVAEIARRWRERAA